MCAEGGACVEGVNRKGRHAFARHRTLRHALADMDGRGNNPMQLAAEVLHELKQPLLGIKGYMQMLGEDPGPHRTVVPLVLAQVERIEQIVADFIRLATNRPAPKERLAVA